MKYYLKSIRTFSYWRYALFSAEALGKFLGVIGTLYLFVELLDTFKLYKKDDYSNLAIIPMFFIALIYVLGTRRPVTRVRYRVPNKDFSIEVKIADLLSCKGQIVISSSSTFDTDMASGLISPNSLQGQFANKFFEGRTDEIDAQIDLSLKNETPRTNTARPGKTNEYPIGTTAHVRAHGNDFYFLAMSHMNQHRNAESSIRIIDEALERLWDYIATRGELGDIFIPLLGTGRGRVAFPRKNMVERIAQSFANASQDKIFSNRLVIIIRPADATRFSINLFQIRDFLSHSLRV
jgi:hypothetical protein